MGVTNVLYMNGGIGETSYANNSLMQQKMSLMTLPITERAIADLYCSITPKSIAIADLGCSSGPNTMLIMSEIIKKIEFTRQRLGHESLQLQIFFNDLPGNDFNTLFSYSKEFHEKLRREIGPGCGDCFIAGVPGSFYDRLFPNASIQFIYSSYCLHWLSQVPIGVESNNENIYVTSTSPPKVLKAYYNQFHNDLSMFLKCRSMEVVSGGKMVLAFVGRKSEYPASKEGCLLWDLLAKALNDMVSEDLIKKESLYSLHIPIYTPSPEEIKCIIAEDESFTFDNSETYEVHWNEANSYDAVHDKDDDGYSFMKCVRSFVEPMLLNHFDCHALKFYHVIYQDGTAASLRM